MVNTASSHNPFWEARRFPVVFVSVVCAGSGFQVTPSFDDQYHSTLIVGLPLAEAVKVTGDPAGPVTLTGWVVTIGGASMVKL